MLRSFPASATTLSFVVLLAYALIYIVPLGYRPLVSPDETRYAEIPREMVQNADWVVPRLNGLRYFEKPPLGYWANAVSLMVFGESNFAVRVVSALSAGLTAVLVYWLALRTGFDRRTALLAGAIYLSCAEVYLVGTFNVLDNLLALLLCAGITALHACLVEPAARRTHWLALWAGVAFGCAFLTKGFLGFVLPAIVLLPWLFWTGRFVAALPALGLAFVGAALVTLPWIIMVHLREADFWRYFFFEEHVRRFLSDDAQHKKPFYYFLLLLPGLAFPWLFFSPAALTGLRSLNRSDPVRSTIRLLWVWMVVPFAFFSYSSGKLTTYILPCFAPGAVLMAVGLMGYLSSERRKLFDSGLGLTAVVFVGLLVFLLLAQLTAWVEPVYQTLELPQVVLGCTAVFGAVLLTGSSIRASAPQVKLQNLFLSMAVLLLVAQFVTPRSLLERKAPGLLLAGYAERSTPETLVVSDSGVIRAVSWYLKRDDVYMIAGGELTYGLAYPDAKTRLLSPARFRELLSSAQDVMLICKRRCTGSYSQVFPRAIVPHSVGLYVLWYVPGHQSPDLIASP